MTIYSIWTRWVSSSYLRSVKEKYPWEHRVSLSSQLLVRSLYSERGKLSAFHILPPVICWWGNPYQNPMPFIFIYLFIYFCRNEQMLKFTWTFKGTLNSNNIFEKEQNWSCHAPWFQTNYKVTVIKTIWYRH